MSFFYKHDRLCYQNAMRRCPLIFAGYKIIYTTLALMSVKNIIFAV